MCGLFGVMRAPDAGDPAQASEAFLHLGLRAQERGQDAAGVALVGAAEPGPLHPYGEESTVAGLAEGDLGDLRIVKGCARFDQVWRDGLRPELDAAWLAFGHTRWATQGAPDELVNTSPWAVAGRVFTHNGDIDVPRLRELFALPASRGSTDSEPLFRALAAAGEDVRLITELLSEVVGRAALAWTDRSRPDRIHLARAALSPLSLARDGEGNLYWASNPAWLRAVGLADITIFDEGTYVCLTRDGEVAAEATFQPTARDWDLDDRVWTGFSPDDMAADRARLRHRVLA
jgi:glutamine phosphoribosylpyrophosphate amidotransferase